MTFIHWAFRDDTTQEGVSLYAIIIVVGFLFWRAMNVLDRWSLNAERKRTRPARLRRMEEEVGLRPLEPPA